MYIIFDVMKEEIIDTKFGNIRIPQPQSYSDVITLIASDNYRRCNRLSRSSVVINILKLNYLAWFRLCQKKDILSPIKNRIYGWLSRKKNINLPIRTKVGYGLYLGHEMCIVINGTTIIGNNVSISQFVNIGSNNHNAAVICDGAYIAPMTCLVEHVTIGFDSVIGAGSVVTHDLSSYKTYAGCPARQISEKANNHWHFYPIE